MYGSWVLCPIDVAQCQAATTLGTSRPLVIFVGSVLIKGCVQGLISL